MCPADGRKVAAQVRGIGMVPTELPEWKRQVMGGAKASFGRKEKKSILEQRQGLPIYKLKDELLKVRDLTWFFFALVLFEYDGVYGIFGGYVSPGQWF